MNKFSKSAKKLSVVLVSVAAASAVGVAFASWTSGGLGSAAATSTTSEESVISAGTFAADLYPGALKSVTVNISNPNDYPVVVTQISDGASAAVNGCAAGSVFSTGLGTATSSDPLAQDAGAGTTIPANGSGVYRLQTRMIGDATNACKAQTFSLALTARVQSAAVTAP
jgi:hypothetical protein